MPIGVVSVLPTRSEMIAAPLGEPNPVDVLAVAPLEEEVVVPNPTPHPNPPQNEVAGSLKPPDPPNGSNPPKAYPLYGDAAATLLKSLEDAA